MAKNLLTFVSFFVLLFAVVFVGGMLDGMAGTPKSNLSLFVHLFDMVSGIALFFSAKNMLSFDMRSNSEKVGASVS